jgi:hypothetical protein
VTFAFLSWWSTLDAWVAAGLFPVAVAILVSGLDDLALDAVWLVAWAKRRLGGAGRARSGRSAARWRSGSPSSCLYGMSTA